jgi:hypothetical protein
MAILMLNLNLISSELNIAAARANKPLSPAATRPDCFRQNVEMNMTNLTFQRKTREQTILGD